MRLAYVMVEARCNLKCPYCFCRKSDARPRNATMTLDRVSHIVDGLAGAGFDGIALTGGEPTLHPRLADCVSVAKTAGLKVWLATNGTRLDGRLCERLAHAGLDRVYLSTDTSAPVPSALDHLERAITELRAAGVDNIHVTWVLNEHTRQDIEPVVSFATECGVDMVFQPAWLGPIDDTASGSGWEGIRSVSDPLIRWARQQGYVRYTQLMLGFFKQGTRPSRCSMGHSRLVIDADGEVFPCFHRRDLACGNAARDSFEQIVARAEAWQTVETGSAACFGTHCLSLFASPDHGREHNE